MSQKTYEDGLNDAWEMANRVSFMDASDVEDIFGEYYTMDEMMETFTAVEAAEKIAEWEKKREFRVNDEVRKKSTGICGVVIYSFGDGRVDVIFKNGSHDICETSKLTKTGRTIDIGSLLKQIGGRNEI